MAKDEKNKKNNNPKKSFFKDSKVELKKVNWPTPKRLANDTATVIGIVVVVAIIVFLLDLLFLTFNEKVIIENEKKLKNTTNDTSIVQEIDNDNQESNSESKEEKSETKNEDVENENVEATVDENTAE